MTSSKERREIDVRFCERACMLSDLGVEWYFLLRPFNLSMPFDGRDEKPMPHSPKFFKTYDKRDIEV